MNIMAGWIMPEMNCARKLAAYICSFASSNSSMACLRWPKTLTNSWPVNISSMWPLTLPVHFHCPTNCPCERFAMNRVTANDSGTVSNDTSASSGEIQNIMPSTPSTVIRLVIAWVMVCCIVVEMLSMSLVTRLSRSPRGWVSKYFSGSRPSLRSTSSRSRYIVRWVTPAIR